MAEPFKCPVCGNEGVQKVAAISMAGSWTGRSLSIGGFAGDVGGSSFGGGTLAQSAHSGASNLVKLLSPPSKPWTSKPIGIVLVLITMTVVAALSAIAWIGAGVSPVSAAGIPCLVMLVIYAAVFLSWNNGRWERDTYAHRLATWSRLIYCSRCHNVYDPQTSRVAPADLMRNLLL